MPKLNERYHLETLIGSRSSTKTYLALDTLSHEKVIVKELSFGRLKNWKNFELFEREIKTLKQINHKSIPRFIEAFKVDKDGECFYYLVTQYIQGDSLQGKMNEGWRPSEKEIRAIAIQILEILKYIHCLEPPVIHRDIKPSNLVMDKKGKVYLIDFGAVQDVLKPSGGSTIVGTFGYMPPEMFTGQSFANSDLYALGTTLIHLFSGTNPADMPRQGLSLDFKPYLSDSPDLVYWLEYLVQPNRRERFQSAEIALLALDDPSSEVAPYEDETSPFVSVKQDWKMLNEEFEVTYTFSGIRMVPLAVYTAISTIIPLLMVSLIWWTTSRFGNSGFLRMLSLGGLAVGAYYGGIMGASRYRFSLTSGFLTISKSFISDNNLNYQLKRGGKKELRFTGEDELKLPLRLNLDDVGQVRLKKNFYGYYKLYIGEEMIADGVPEEDAFYLQKKILQYLVKHQKPENAKSSLLQLRSLSHREKSLPKSQV